MSRLPESWRERKMKLIAKPSRGGYQTLRTSRAQIGTGLPVKGWAGMMPQSGTLDLADRLSQMPEWRNENQFPNAEIALFRDSDCARCLTHAADAATSTVSTDQSKESEVVVGEEVAQLTQAPHMRWLVPS